MPESHSRHPDSDLIVRKAEITADRDKQMRAARRFAGLTYHKMLSREERSLLRGGFRSSVARVAAENNLALRRLELEDELLTELARIQTEAREKLERLLEERNGETDR